MIEKPIQYLKAWVSSRFPKDARPLRAELAGKGAYIDYEICVGKAVSLVRLLMPHDAPVGAHPLCATIWFNSELVWSFRDDVDPNEASRVALHHEAGHYVLLYIKPGVPEVLTEVKLLIDVVYDTEVLSYEGELFLRQRLAGPLGLRVEMTKKERAIVEHMQKRMRKT